MSTLCAIVFLIIYGIESLVGITANAFIVVVNLTSRAKGIALTPSDHILPFLGLSNLCVQGTSLTAGVSFFFWVQLFNKGFPLQVFSFFLMFGSFSSFWFTSLLLMSYCLKMMNNTQPSCCLSIRKMMMKNIFWISLINITFAFGIGAVEAFNVFRYDLHETANLTSNYSLPDLRKSIPYNVLLILAECTWPMVITSLYVLQLLKNIWKHVQNIKKSMAGSGEPNLNAHRGATTTLMSHLILYVSYCLTWTIFLLCVFSYCSIWFLLSMTMLSILTSAQAITIIMGRPKLKKEALRILQIFRPPTDDT